MSISSYKKQKTPRIGLSNKTSPRDYETDAYSISHISARGVTNLSAHMRSTSPAISVNGGSITATTTD